MELNTITRKPALLHVPFLFAMAGSTLQRHTAPSPKRGHLPLGEFACNALWPWSPFLAVPFPGGGSRRQDRDFSRRIGHDSLVWRCGTHHGGDGAMKRL